MQPLVHIGWVLTADTRNEAIIAECRRGAQRLQSVLEQQFPRFRWRVEFLHRHRYAPRGTLDPLHILEYGVQEKTVQRWDYGLMIVTNALEPRQRVRTLGVPSSALEMAVLSTADLGSVGEMGERLVALALHLLGHVWGLEHEEEGPMVPPESVEHLQIAPFPEQQQEAIRDRLDEVADKRLEEQQRSWNMAVFYLRAFLADPKSILIDTIGYAPWRLPLQMGRLTAATAVSLVFLLLAAESWEIGVNLSVAKLAVGSIFAVLLATLFIFNGQNLGEFSRQAAPREQLTRTRIVIFGTLLLGIIALWLLLFVVSYLAARLMPEAILAGWIGVPTVGNPALLRQSAFMALNGVLAGALGGNLEDEEKIKAKLLYDEET